MRINHPLASLGAPAAGAPFSDGFAERFAEGLAGLPPLLLAILLMQFVLVAIAVFTAVMNRLEINRVKTSYNALADYLGNGESRDIFQELASIIRDMDYSNRMKEKDIAEIYNILSTCVQKVGVVRYNAFNDISNELSYSVALLDDNDDGFVLSGIYGRDAATTYAKPVSRGGSRYPLTQEEGDAIREARRRHIGRAYYTGAEEDGADGAGSASFGDAYGEAYAGDGAEPGFGADAGEGLDAAGEGLDADPGMAVGAGESADGAYGGAAGDYADGAAGFAALDAYSDESAGYADAYNEADANPGDADGAYRSADSAYGGAYSDFGDTRNYGGVAAGYGGRTAETGDGRLYQEEGGIEQPDAGVQAPPPATLAGRLRDTRNLANIPRNLSDL